MAGGPRVAGTVALGALGGLALGIAARAWMRLIAAAPEFTWAGTAGILVGFTLFGLTQTLCAVTRRRTRRPGPVAAVRAGGALGILPLFVAAGATMAPAVVAGGFAVARPRWPWPARALCLLVAAAPVVFVASEIVGDFGASLRTVAGIAGLLALYATIIVWARPTFAAPASGARLMPRPVRLALAGAGLALAGAVAVFSTM